jgi:hypothetical protein
MNKRKSLLLAARRGGRVNLSYLRDEKKQQTSITLAAP